VFCLFARKIFGFYPRDKQLVLPFIGFDFVDVKVIATMEKGVSRAEICWWPTNVNKDMRMAHVSCYLANA
jgi:hypothetical protein